MGGPAWAYAGILIYCYMQLIAKWGWFFKALLIIIALFIGASLLDVFLSVLYSRIYTTAAFIVVFGVAGIFAGLFTYTRCMEWQPLENRPGKITTIIFLLICGALFFFLLATLEGGEYAAAFRSYGLTLAFSSAVFWKEKQAT